MHSDPKADSRVFYFPKILSEIKCFHKQLDFLNMLRYTRSKI